MLDVSGYGCLAARGQGERHSASTYKFVNVYFPACYILLYLVSQDSTRSPDCMLARVSVCVCGWVCACVIILGYILGTEILIQLAE